MPTVHRQLWAVLLSSWLVPLALTTEVAMGATSPVQVYPFSPELPASTHYSVQVKGEPVFVHAAEVADFACFAIGGPVTVSVTCKEDVTSALVRPRSRKIETKIAGKTVSFAVDSPGPLTLEINGKIRPALHLFIDPPEENAPAVGAPGVIRFAGNKVHEVGEIVLKDNETLYLEPGAVVRGVVRATGAKNVRILGRGILDARPRTTKTKFVDLRDCDGVQMSDVTVVGSFGWTLVPWRCRNVRFDNVKVFSWRDNDDGLDICGCRDVVVDRCFFRTKDDCISIKSPQFDPSGKNDVADVLVQRSVFWNAEWGNAMEIGFELQTPKISGVVWRDCDIIRVETGAVFSIHNGGVATVQDVLFENIRVEDARDKFLDLHVGLSIYSDDCPERYHRRNPQRKPTGAGQWVPFSLLTEEEQAVSRQRRGVIRNVRLKDIQLLEQVPPHSFLINDGGTLENVTYENVLHEGKALQVLTTQ